MKKNYFYLILVLPLISLLFLSSSAGYTIGASGSPGDSNSTCSGCHSGGNFNASVAITSNIPSGGYALNTNYNITVTLTSSPNSTKSGFQITAEKSGGVKVGNFIAGTGSQTINANKAVTHTDTGNTQKTWTFTWTSPTTNQGLVTFYAVANATNSNGNITGDQVVTTSASFNVLSNESFELAAFKLFPNPTSNLINIELPEGFTEANALVVDVMGKTIVNQLITETNTIINIENLPAGTYILNLSTEEGSATKTFVKH